MSRPLVRRARFQAMGAVAVLGATVVSTGAPSRVGAAPVTKTFASVADARIEQAHPKTNYASSKLRVDKGSSSSINSYLKFTTSGLSGPVQSARLRLRVQSNGSGNGSSLYPVADSWTERTITWNNAPAASPSRA